MKIPPLSGVNKALKNLMKHFNYDMWEIAPKDLVVAVESNSFSNDV